MVEFPDRDDVMVRRLLQRKRDGSHSDYRRHARASRRRCVARLPDVVRIDRSSLRARCALYHAVPRSMQLLSYGWRLAHLTALWGYGVSVPDFFSMLKGNPEFLVINGSFAHRGDGIRARPRVWAAARSDRDRTCLWTRLVEDLEALMQVLFVWLFGSMALMQVLARFDPTPEPLGSSFLPVVWLTSGWSRICVGRPFGRSCPYRGSSSRFSRLFSSSQPLRSALADAEGAQLKVGGALPVAFVVFDEFAVSSLMRVTAPSTRSASLGSGDSRANPRGTPTPLHGQRGHDVRRPGDPHRGRPARRSATDPSRLSAQRLLASRRVIEISSRPGARHAPLSGAVLPGAPLRPVAPRARQGTPPRLHHQFPPRRLPRLPRRQRFFCCARDGALGGEPGTGTREFIESIRGSNPARLFTSSTSSSHTCPGTCCLWVSAATTARSSRVLRTTGSPEVTSDGARIPASSIRASNGTCSRSERSTGSWVGTRSTDCTSRASTIER